MPIGTAHVGIIVHSVPGITECQRTGNQKTTDLAVFFSEHAISFLIETEPFSDIGVAPRSLPRGFAFQNKITALTFSVVSIFSRMADKNDLDTATRKGTTELHFVSTFT